MQAYLDIGKKILEEGKWIKNKRTGQKTLAIIGATFEHDLSTGTVPVVTTKKLFWKAAIGEMLGYIRGYRSAAQFRALGVILGMPMQMRMMHGLVILIVRVKMTWGYVTVSLEEHFQELRMTNHWTNIRRS